MKTEKIYYLDPKLTIRSMRKTDIQNLLNAFQAQGWDKPLSVLEKYYAEDQTERRLLFIAEWEGRVSGYTTLMKEAEHGPFAHNGVPYVCDFNVFMPYQRRGIGSKIMDCAERAAFEKHDKICIGVGLHPGYGTAQRMYAKRGYIPDGSGIWYHNEPAAGGIRMDNDDDLVLYMEKQKPLENEAVYYRDRQLCIRSLREEDIPKIQEGFLKEGWEKPLHTLLRYLSEDLTEARRVFLAEWEGEIAGYTTLMKEAEHGPYAFNDVPYVCDFTIFSPFRNKGIGSRVMDAVERTAFEKCDRVCLGVGMYQGYGSAQRMYARRGYIPDGSGVWYLNSCVPECGECFNDDDLILYMEKKKP